MEDRFEIKLTQWEEEAVSLGSMSAEALNSFLIVVESLKSLVESLGAGNDLRFSLQEGSALCAVDGSQESMEAIYKGVDCAIRGESSNEVLTQSLRKIQSQVKLAGSGYEFIYKNQEISIPIHGRLREAPKIRRRRQQNPYSFQLKLVNGIINQIGGNNPNYHFDFGSGDSLTIDCSREQAQEVNKYLYEKVDAIVLAKVWEDTRKKDELFHKVLIAGGQSQLFRNFLEKYNQEKDLVEKLMLMYDFADEILIETETGLTILNLLFKAFNDPRLHASELKTLLVISKSFRQQSVIREERKALLGTYENMLT